MSIDHVCSLIAAHAHRADSGIDGVYLAKVKDPTEPTPSIAEPILAFSAQGSKRIALGDRVYDQLPGQYMSVMVDLPITGNYVEASWSKPYLGFGLRLEASDIAALLVESEGLGAGSPPTQATGITMSTASDDLVDAIGRMLKLIDRPQDAAVLAPMVKREILWHALTGPQGGTIRQIGMADSSLTHVGRAIRHIRSNAFDALQVEELAHVAGMSVSAFHRQFRLTTAMSPIQYQKRIRLQEARLRLFRDPTDIAGIGHAVGYSSASQFSREYRREFGLPPTQDAVRLREPDPSSV